MKPTLKTALAVSLLLIVSASCSDDDSDPAGPGGGAVAPSVVSVTPADGAVNVTDFQDIAITFDRDMAAASADGNVTSSLGDVVGTSWMSPRILTVTHTEWPEATRITMTAGTGLTDTDANALAAPFIWSFTTATLTPTLLGSAPADGAVGVARNSQVRLQFSTDMDMGSLISATTATATAAKADVPFQLAAASDGWVEMNFLDDLPATSVIDIAVSTSASSVHGYNLPQAVAISFTTSDVLDSTPPALVSIAPAGGSVVPASTSEIVFTFDEAVDQTTFEPAMLSAQFALLLDQSDTSVSWSGDGMSMTVPLPAPLPAGLPIAARFDGFADIAGNMQTAVVSYRIDVSGTGDAWPLLDGSRFVYDITEIETPPGGVPAEYGYFDYYQVEEQTNGDIRWTSYNSDQYTTSFGYDIYRRSASSISETGWYWNENGETDQGTISPGAVWAKLPFAVQSWDGSGSITLPGGTLAVSYDVAVVGREDLPAMIEDTETEYVWLDCWKATRAYTLTDGGAVVGTGQGTYWFAPTVGIVKSEMLENEEDGASYDTTQHLTSFSN